MVCSKTYKAIHITVVTVAKSMSGSYGCQPPCTATREYESLHLCSCFNGDGTSVLMTVPYVYASIVKGPDSKQYDSCCYKSVMCVLSKNFVPCTVIIISSTAPVFIIRIPSEKLHAEHILVIIFTAICSHVRKTPSTGEVLVIAFVHLLKLSPPGSKTRH